MQKLRFNTLYSHILLPIVIHNALIWRVLTVLREIGALPASRSVELVPHEGFEMSRKNPGTVIEIFRDNLGIEKFFCHSQIFFPNPMIHRLIRSDPWMMLNCSETKKWWIQDEMKCNAQEKCSIFQMNFHVSSNFFERCREIVLFMLLSIESKMQGWKFFQLFLFAQRTFHARTEFWGRMACEANRANTCNLFFPFLNFLPNRFYAPRYQTINLKSCERRSSTLREIE